MISNPLPLAELLETGVAIMVATRDAELRTHMTRGWGGYLDAGTGHGGTLRPWQVLWRLRMLGFRI